MKQIALKLKNIVSFKEGFQKDINQIKVFTF